MVLVELSVGRQPGPVFHRDGRRQGNEDLTLELARRASNAGVEAGTSLTEERTNSNGHTATNRAPHACFLIEPPKRSVMVQAGNRVIRIAKWPSTG